MKQEMSIVTIENDNLVIKVNTHGAELVSLVEKKNSKEYMWCGDAKYWGRVSPVLFPFVGKLEKQTYRHQGVVYENIPQHGFARDSEFEVVEQTKDAIWFSLIKDETWAKNYPFRFEFQLGYQLDGKKVHVIWKVENTGAETLHFSIGAHPAFACEGGLAGYSLDMHTQKAQMECGVLNASGVLSGKTIIKPLENGILPLNDQLFEEDALILDGKAFNMVTLQDKDCKPVLQVKFDTPQLGIWSPAKAHAPFVCIEPWYGRCDREGFSGSLEEREFSNSLESGCIFQKEYVIEIL